VGSAADMKKKDFNLLLTALAFAFFCYFIAVEDIAMTVGYGLLTIMGVISTTLLYRYS
jgi:multidrug transporter EmrE-like cation transporter